MKRQKNTRSFIIPSCDGFFICDEFAKTHYKAIFLNVASLCRIHDA